MFVETRLYYPNNWRRNVGDLVPAEDKRFNWFICSKRYMDPVSGFYVADISKGTKFYEEKTGENMTTPLEGEDVKLLIVDKNTSLASQLKSVEKYKYQGYTTLVECDIRNPDESFVCREVIFWFKKGVLIPIKTDKVCALIDYAKKHNECIRSKIRDFPLAEEIENMMKTRHRSEVCKDLYKDLIKYMNT